MGVGADRFCDLCDMGALLIWSGSVYSLAELERGYMKELGISPLIYWAQQKRAVRPLLAAGGETLRALGVPVEGEPSTVHDLARAVASVLAEDMGPRNYGSDLYSIALDIDRRLGVLLCERGNRCYAAGCAAGYLRRAGRNQRRP